MNKAMILMMCVVFLFQNGHTQMPEEWLNQKKTQREYLLKQIAAFKAYAGFVEEGISVVQSGLGMISKIKQGDYSIHNDFFTSLQTVNPKIKNSSKVAAIIVMQTEIQNLCKKVRKKIIQQPSDNGGENRYINAMLDNLLVKCISNVNELLTLTSNKNIKLKDDERITRIDKLYNGVLDKYGFIQHFANEVDMLLIQRLQETTSIKTSRRLYGIKQ